MDSREPECDAFGKSRSTTTADESSQSIGPTFDDGTTCELGRSLTPNGPTLSAAGSLVRTSASKIRTPKGSTAPAPVCGQNTSASFARFSRRSCVLKTSQRSLFGGWIDYCETLPPAGTMRNGRLYRRKRLARRTVETEFSLWPTAQASDAKRMSFSTDAHLKQQARNQRDGFGGGPASLNLVLHCKVDFDGVPTANFVEWLMGFPINWTDTGDSETPSSPKSPNGSAAE